MTKPNFSSCVSAEDIQTVSIYNKMTTVTADRDESRERERCTDTGISPVGTDHFFAYSER